MRTVKTENAIKSMIIFVVLILTNFKGIIV